MRLFISWSGRRSHRLAVVLKEWLETNFSGHGISVFVSSEITEGSLWLPSVNAELRGADAGLICLTASSLDSQWMLFEAGALSTAVALGTGESRIFTYLLGVDRAALPSPLSVYQSAVATMEDTLRLINSLLGYLNAGQVGAGAFVSAWDDLWPRLQRIEEEEEMPDWSLKGIFLSYRREDAGPYARLLQYELRERILDARVFMDLDSIEAGLDFAEVIRQAVESCAVVVALIGRQWATLTDEEGRLRLDDPDDYVRYEIEAALARGVRVIPVLVDGARPLRQLQLPAELRKLARLNALELSYSRYQYDSDRLLDLLQRLLAAAPSASPPDPATTPDDELEAAVRRLASSAASRNIQEAINGLLAMGYTLKPPRTIPGKRPENYLRIIDPKYPAPAVGYLTPRTFSFSRATDRDSLKDLPGAWLVSNAVNLSHEQSAQQGLDVARGLKG